MARLHAFSFFIMALLLFFSPTGSAHPMDLGRLDIRIAGDRLVATLRLHEMAAERLLSQTLSPKASISAQALFVSTLGLEPSKMNALECRYLRPELSADQDDVHYLLLSVVITCPWTMSESIHLTWELPFLAQMADSFQLVATLPVEGRLVTLVANRQQPSVEFGQSSRTFPGFLKMGLVHIGARIEEWKNRDGDFKFPDGIDHILFIIGLVLSGGSLWGLFKTATGFTVGHSITLALSTYRIIHIHSKWIEVAIAFSIAFVAGRAFCRKERHRAENWIVAGLFGIVHGLGFSAALQDLELSKSEMLTALLGFNVGVELGQCFFILLTLAILILLAKLSQEFETVFRKTAALVICLIGLYWVYYRAFV
jgi:hypothetical protein